MIDITVYCDGSGNTFDSDGAWAYRALIDGVVFKDDSGYLEKATNNVAELTAAIKALEYSKYLAQQIAATHSTEEVHVSITLISDSQLTLGYAKGSYKCKAEHLRPLYDRIRMLHDELNVNTKWVKGHSGDINNEACDVLAGTARNQKRGLSDDLSNETKI